MTELHNLPGDTPKKLVIKLPDGLTAEINDGVWSIDNDQLTDEEVDEYRTMLKAGNRPPDILECVGYTLTEEEQMELFGI